MSPSAKSKKPARSLDRLPVRNPFDERYGTLQLPVTDWETCSQVLNRHEKLEP